MLAKSKKLSLIFGVTLVIVVLIWLLTNPAADNTAVVKQYLVPYPNVISPIQRQNSGETTVYEEAFRMYELGYFDKAEDIFNRLDSTDESVQFYRSVNALLDNNSELARLGFNGIIEDQEHRFYIPAQWYCALEYLLSEKEKQGVLMLKELANGHSNFAVRAQELLDDLK